MSENTPEQAAKRTMRVGPGSAKKVLAEVEDTVKAVTELAGSDNNFREAGDRLKKYGAIPEIVDVAVELAEARF